MSLSAIKAPFSLIRASILIPSNTGRWSKISQIVHRWSSTKSMGASPSQLPVPGEPEWEEFVAHVKRGDQQLPLSPADLEQKEQKEQKRKISNSGEKSVRMTVLLKGSFLPGDFSDEESDEGRCEIERWNQAVLEARKKAGENGN